MSRVATSNYGADAITQFQWATTDDDQFDRELDIYRLSQALELHDHSIGRGLPVARVAAGAVDAAALAALSVATGTIQDGAVTNAKLGAASVSRDKLSMPWVQATNDFAGGIRIRETANNYALGYYMAANGLAVFGAGTPSVIGTNLILGQTGKVSVGTAEGGALFNVLQTSNAVAGGIRVYNSNVGFFGDFYNNASGWPAISAGAFPCVTFEPAARGGLVIGATASASGKLTIQQAAGTAAEGIWQTFGSGIFKAFVDTPNNDVNLQSAATSIILKHAAAALIPATNNAVELGQTGSKWSKVWATAADIGGVTVAASGALLTTSGGLIVAGALSGVTSLAMSGALSGATTIAGSGVATLGGVTSNFINGASDGTGNLGTTSNRFSRLYLMDAVAVGLTSVPGFQVHLSLDSAAKTNGGSWTNPSDRRLKLESSIHDYDSGLDTVLALRPRHFHWNGLGQNKRSAKDDPYMVGFIADEVRDVAPEMYREYQGYLHDDDEEMTDIGAVNDSALPYILINALKTLHERIVVLEDQLKDRKN